MKKKIKKTIEDWDALIDKYEEVRLTNNDRKILECQKELVDYLKKNRKILKLTEKFVNKAERKMRSYEQSVISTKIVEAEAAEAHRISEKSKEKYFEALLNFPPIGKERTKH
ncbi:MAG: hypothetical protein K1X72_17480 [Pyrinomonadaceae bacterium]|nr:hypothetical protein [Pyrinomonadaceae bacterium]